MPKILLLSLACLVFMAGTALAAGKHVYLLDVVHGSPAEQTDAQLKAAGFTELKKRQGPEPDIYNLVYTGKIYGVPGTIEVSYYKGVTLGITASLPAKTPEEQKAGRTVFEDVLARWTKAYGEPDKPMSDLYAWLLDDKRVVLNLGEPDPNSEDPTFLLAANRPYLD